VHARPRAEESVEVLVRLVVTEKENVVRVGIPSFTFEEFFFDSIGDYLDLEATGRSESKKFSFRGF
jgi:hypothetical protein